MRVNTAKSLRLGARVKRRYGSWDAVKAASRLENGIYVVEQPPRHQSPIGEKRLADGRFPSGPEELRGELSVNVGTEDRLKVRTENVIKRLRHQIRTTRILVLWLVLTSTLTFSASS